MAAQPEASLAFGLHVCECGEELVGELFLAVHQKKMKHGPWHNPCPRCQRRTPECSFAPSQRWCRDCQAKHREQFKPDGSGEQRDGMTLEEVAQELGLSRERVRQIEQVAIRKLRQNPRTLRIVKQLLEGRD